MSIASTLRRLARAFKAAGNSYRESSSNASRTSANSVEWQSSADDEVVLCEAGRQGARLIAAASLYGRVQVRVCQKNMNEEEFRTEFSMAYTYGPGGSERSGTDVNISFTSEDNLLAIVEEDKEWEERRDPYLKRLPRLRVTDTTFKWAVINSKSRHFQFPARQ